MSKPKVWVTRFIPNEGLQELAECSEMEISKRPPTKEEIMAKLPLIDAMLCVGTPLGEKELAVAKKLRIISNYGVGYNHIDIDAATRCGIMVTNLPYDVTEATADLTFGLLLASARRIAEADRALRSKEPLDWGPMLLNGHDVYGKTLGIIGLGRIGRAVARRAQGFNMKILYYDICRQYEAENAMGVEFLSKDELLQEADFVSLHVPLTPDSRHLIGSRELALMKRTAYLINSSRGPVINEQALLEALREGAIAGAGLDVFEHEPKLTPGLSDCPNVVMTPHVGTSTAETRIRMAKAAAASIIAVLKGEEPPFLVNKEVLN